MQDHTVKEEDAACRSVGQKWNMPMELAFDLCTLALYDVAIYADDSTSMKYAEGLITFLTHAGVFYAIGGPASVSHSHAYE